MSFEGQGSAPDSGVILGGRQTEAEYLRRERLLAFEAMRATWKRLPRVACATVHPIRNPLIGLGLFAAAAAVISVILLRFQSGGLRAAAHRPMAMGIALLSSLSRSAWNLAVSALITRLFFGREDTVLRPAAPDDGIDAPVLAE